MKILGKAAIVAATASMAVGALTLPANASSVSAATAGKTGCFTYNYKYAPWYAPSNSVTVHYTNTCKTTKRLHIRVSHSKDACLTVKGKTTSKKRFSNALYIPRVQEIKQVTRC